MHLSLRMHARLGHAFCKTAPATTRIQHIVQRGCRPLRCRAVSPERPGDGQAQAPVGDGSGGSSRPPATPALPTLLDGVNWYCTTALALIFLTDFTPVGALIASGPGAPLNLALLQWLVFVAPTVNLARSRGWDLADTFQLRPCSPKWLLTGALGGSVLWAAVHAALAVKAGVWAGAWQLPDGAPLGADGRLVADSLAAAAASPGVAAGLLALVALSPAVAEELLFRGLLLTALRQRLGRVDAVAVCGALFALVHLSPEQFFPLAMLGFGAGAVATASGSVVPAVLLHFAYNATALAAGAWLLGAHKPS